MAEINTVDTKRRKIYYVPGLVSLLLLPVLFYSIQHHNIDKMLIIRSIEFNLPPAEDGSFVDNLSIFPQIYSKYKKYTFTFVHNNENSQIDSFRNLHRKIESNKSNEMYYFTIEVDSLCSYELYIQVLNTLDPLKYNYDYRGNVLYAVRMTEESINSSLVSYSKHLRYKKKYGALDMAQMLPNQIGVIIVIGIMWLTLFIFAIKRTLNNISAT